MRTEKPTSQTGLAVQTQIKAGESRDECKTRCNAQDNANYRNGADKSYAAAEYNPEPARSGIGVRTQLKVGPNVFYEEWEYKKDYCMNRPQVLKDSCLEEWGQHYNYGQGYPTRDGSTPNVTIDNPLAVY